MKNISPSRIPLARFFQVGGGSGSLGMYFGIMDLGVAFSYAVHIDSSIYYAGTLIAKFILIIARGRVRSRPFTAMNVSLIGLLVVSAFVGVYNMASMPELGLQLFGFTLHLILTGQSLTAEDVEPYCKGVAATLAALLIYYVWSVHRGAVKLAGGLRFYFLGGTQPNLGGEIIAAGLFLSGIALRPRYFIPLSFVALVGVGLLQARSAILAVMYMQGLCLGFLYLRWRSLWGKAMVICLLVAAVIAFWGPVHHVVDIAFALSSKGRGLGSGFSGRTAEWRFAWNAFFDSPIFGQGYGFFKSIGNIGAHNLFLFVLAETGLVGVGILLWLMNGAIRLGRFREIAWFSSFLFLAMFNDRFINLNPYPFLYYVIVWIPPQFISVACLRDRREVVDGMSA